MILQIATGQLSLGAQGDDVVRVHRALRALGRSVPVAETDSRVLGPGTAAVLKALQQELGIPATGVVDGVTVRMINDALGKRAAEPRVVRGSVRDVNGNPFTKGFVEIFSQGRAAEQGTGIAPLNSADGSFAITYQPPPSGDGRVDLRVQVFSADSGGTAPRPPRPLETKPSGASILTNAGPLEVVNFVVGGAASPPKTEYEQILADITPLLGGLALADVKEDEHHEVSLIAAQSGFKPEQIAALVKANQLVRDTRLPAPVSFGLLRQGLPTDPAALRSVHDDIRRKAPQAAAAKGVVPTVVDGKPIEDWLADLAPPAAAPLQGLLGGILNANELDTFVGKYLESSQDPAAFWRQIAADPALGGRAADLKLRGPVRGLDKQPCPTGQRGRSAA